MSIEPTEEQKQAALALFDDLNIHPYADSVGWVAQLLAEREAKLREDMKAEATRCAVDLFAEYRRAGFVSPHPAVDLGEAFHLDLDARFAPLVDVNFAQQHTLRARVAELENSLAACRGTLFADDRYNEARTREAVMPSFDCGGENCGRISCSDCTDDDLHARYWQELGKGPGGDAGAEHRARAWWTTEGKRLKAASEREAQHLADIKALRGALSEGYALALNARERVLKATAHYDDAK